ncbi:SOS response-associated peptidase family protein [Lacisediminihabitans sp.]|uniref:SOS response-associated peptidase family protein n=1 Tax=Lacisediminihabitans sp. TaxID=2787631 RepID=UPI0039C8FA5F
MVAGGVLLKAFQLEGPTFNARTEGILKKSTWKKPVQLHRAIVIAKGHYER